MEEKTATIRIREKKITCRSNTPVWQVMKEKGYPRSGFLILRNGELITDDEIIKSGEILELIPVISGG